MSCQQIIFSLSLSLCLTFSLSVSLCLCFSFLIFVQGFLSINVTWHLQWVRERKGRTVICVQCILLRITQEYLEVRSPKQHITKQASTKQNETKTFQFEHLKRSSAGSLRPGSAITKQNRYTILRCSYYSVYYSVLYI